MNFRYLLGVIISIPLLPLMYFQGKRIRTKIPKLPEAEGITGQCKTNQLESQKKLKVIFIGESTIAGVGVKTHEEGFPGTFANELSGLLNLNVSWRVYAKSGYTAKNVRQNLIPKITEKQVDLMVVGLGGNDAFKLTRPSKWKKEMHSLIKKLNAKYPKAKIVFCNMPPIKEFPAFTPLIKFTIGNLVEILGDELQNVANHYDNIFYFGDRITLNKWMDRFHLTQEKSDFFSDGVHPSKLTYQTWAKDVAQNVSKNEQIKFALLNDI